MAEWGFFFSKLYYDIPFFFVSRFVEGSLHPANVLMCPHTCVTNLPKPREAHPDVGTSEQLQFPNTKYF